MHLSASVQSVCWFVFDPKRAAVNDLNSVWSSISLSGTPVGKPNRYAKLWRHNDLIYARYHHWRFVNKFNCFKHDVTIASGSQATVRKCNDYSGSNARSFSSRCRRHDTLSLLTVITKVLVEGIIEPVSCARVRFWRSNQKKMQKLAELFCRTGNIYS